MPESGTRSPASANRGGMPYAVATYLIWGLFPLYFMLVRMVAPTEMVGWRVVCTLPFCALLVSFRGQWPAVRRALFNARTLGVLAASSLVIGANWLLYVWAVVNEHVLAASLGYYINPLLNVLAGTLFLREKLTRLQWVAVALAAIGVIILAWGALSMLWIGLGLASCFCAYGLLRKLAPVEALPGLTVETIVLFIPGVALIAAQAMSAEGMAMGQSLRIDLLLVAAGVLTGLPLLMFSEAARRMDYSTLGFVQFLTPTLVFICGIAIFREPVNPVQLVCFAFIWCAIGVFSWDLLARRRRPA